MKIEIDDGLSAAMEMTVSNTLALGTLMDLLCKVDLIDRSDLVSELSRRRMSFQAGEDDGHAWAFLALEEALMPQPDHPERGSAPSLRLVWSAEA